jgi:hypothetical protein
MQLYWQNTAHSELATNENNTDHREISNDTLGMVGGVKHVCGKWKKNELDTSRGQDGSLHSVEIMRNVVDGGRVRRLATSQKTMKCWRRVDTICVLLRAE